MTRPNWYTVRHVLIWVTGTISAILSIACLFEMIMVINRTLDPELLFIDLCFAAASGLTSYKLFKEQEYDDYTPTKRSA